MRWKRSISLVLLAAITAVMVMVAQPSVAQIPAAIATLTAQSSTAQQLEQQGRTAYAQGRFADAATSFTAAAAAYAAAGDSLNQAMMLSNLSLAEQQQGNWTAATTAVDTAIALLSDLSDLNTSDTGASDPSSTDAVQQVLAQTLDIQAQLQFAQGRLEDAAATWEQAAAAYRQGEDELGAWQSQVNRAQALQSLGYYRQSLTVLNPVVEALQTQPSSKTQVLALRSLGEALRVQGSLPEAQQALEQSLRLAQELQLADAASAAHIGLGEVAQLQRDWPCALIAYQEGAIAAASPLPRVQAQLGQFKLLINRQYWEPENGQEPGVYLDRWLEASQLWPQIQAAMAALPASRAALYAQVNFVQQILDFQRAIQTELNRPNRTAANVPPTQVEFAQPSPGSPSNPALIAIANELPDIPDLVQQLRPALQQAQQLGDGRTESYILGLLGELYERSGQLADAQALTQEALARSQSNNAAEASYRWQWQLGRVLKEQNQNQAAIKAYTESVQTLQSLRDELASASAELQFSFREDVEPIYRELADLLLAGETTDPQRLDQAREVIESLQLAELDNFFREACLDAEPKQIDEIDENAAVVYTILLSDRLEVLLRLPDGSWSHKTTYTDRQTVESTLDDLWWTISYPGDSWRGGSRSEAAGFALTRGGGNLDALDFMPLAQQAYDWLIRPIEADLAAAQPQTLVFVLDGQWRKVPMSVLHDGNQFLVENYAIALAPGLQLLESEAITRRDVRAILAGLSDMPEFAQPNWGDLPHVRSEVEAISALVPSEVLLNQSFEIPQLETQVSRLPFPVVHLATHGKFSSDLSETFVLTWDGELDAEQLSKLLQSSELTRDGAVELLILSACETATGDDRAALGLAGVAVRSGARSTLATLWLVDDAATADLMVDVYRTLSETSLTKAQVVQQVQKNFLQDDERKHPYYWAPFVLVGNWL